MAEIHVTPRRKGRGLTWFLLLLLLLVVAAVAYFVFGDGSLTIAGDTGEGSVALARLTGIAMALRGGGHGTV